MKLNRLVSLSVQKSLKESAFYYDSKQKNLGKRFLQEVSLTSDYICANPLVFQIRYDTIRIAFLENFPYGIHYEFIEDENQINIYAVFHTSLNPEIWVK